MRVQVRVVILTSFIHCLCRYMKISKFSHDSREVQKHEYMKCPYNKYNSKTSRNVIY